MSKPSFVLHLSLSLVCLTFLVFNLFQPTISQVSKQDSLFRSTARKADLPYVKCEFCEAFVKNVVEHVQTLKQERAARGKKLFEVDIIDYLEKSCDPDEPEGEWITKYDLVESRKRLKLVNTQKWGKCKTECRTLEYACQKLQEDFDVADLSARMSRGILDPSVLTQWVCREETDVCRKPPPGLPKNRPPGEAHLPIDDEERQANSVLRNMRESGVNGKVYSYDTMLEELDRVKEDYMDDEDLHKEVDALKEKASQSLRRAKAQKEEGQDHPYKDEV